MIKREFLTAISNGEMNDELMAFAANEIVKMDVANEKRRNAPKKPSKAAIENVAHIEKICAEFLGEEPKTASEIGAYLEVTPQKATGIMRQAVKAGQAKSVDLKIKGRTVKGYTL